MSKKSTLVEKWYVLHTYSGREYKVKQLLTERVNSFGIGDRVVSILVPDEERIEVRGNKRKIVQKKCFPGYVLVKVLVEPYIAKTGTEYKMESDVWYVIRNTQGVAGFIGGNSTPTPIDEHEVDAIQNRMKRYTENPTEELKFNVGDKLEIIKGSFIGSFGRVDSMDLEHMKLTVMVEMFNRLTPVEVSFDEVKPL